MDSSFKTIEQVQDDEELRDELPDDEQDSISGQLPFIHESVVAEDEVENQKDEVTEVKDPLETQARVEQEFYEDQAEETSQNPLLRLGARRSNNGGFTDTVKEYFTYVVEVIDIVFTTIVSYDYRAKINDVLNWFRSPNQRYEQVPTTYPHNLFPN